MKKLLLCFICLLVLPVFAQNTTPFCTKLSASVYFHTHPGTPKYMTNYSKEDFLRRAETKYSPYTLGLTVVKPDVTVSVKPEVTRELEQICVGLSQVDIDMSYPTMTVYIDKKYAPSSCEYRTIKEHEDYHVNVAQQALTFFRPDVERVVAKTISNMSPQIVHSQAEIQAVTEKFASQINDAIRPVIQHMRTKLAEKNATIDTQEMYQATTAVCKNW